METISLVKSLGALGLVIGLIAVVALLARHFGLTGGSGGRRRDERRLGVVESLTLDARRRVVLVRCDAGEHLVLLGLNSEVILTPKSEPVPSWSNAGQTGWNNSGPPPQEPAPSSGWRQASPRAPYRRDEPTLGPLPPRGR